MQAPRIGQCSVGFVRRPGVSRVLAFLRAADASFRVPLSERVVLEDYAAKLAEHGYNFFAERAGEDVGHAAVYLDATRSTAFLSSIAVRQDVAGQGLGTMLLDRVLAFCREQGARRIGLEVHGDAVAALRMYESRGFVRDDAAERAGMRCLSLALDGRVIQGVSQAGASGGSGGAGSTRRTRRP